MDADEVATRVRQVIAASGVPQGEFAAHAGLDASKMSKALAGVRRFSSLDLANIAEVGGVTVDFLLGVERPQPDVAARAAARSEAILNGAVVEAKRIAEFRADLAFLGRMRPQAPRPPVRHSGWLRQGERLAADALALRYAAGDVAGETLEDMIERVFGIDVARVPIDDHCDGLAWRDDNCSLIVVGTTDSATRQRFTLAHELCHLLAGDNQGLHLDGDVMHAADVTEKRANVFAAAFLMPADDLRAAHAGWQSDDVADEDFSRLVMELGVSPSALAWRLFNLQLVSEIRRAQLGRLTTAFCAHLASGAGRLADWTEQSQQRRIPAALAQDLFAAYLDGEATLRPFANLLGADAGLLREIFEKAHEPEGQAGELTFAP